MNKHRFWLFIYFHWSCLLYSKFQDIWRWVILIIITCIVVCKLKIRTYGRKTYTLNFRTIKKRCLSGVVAKPGIATGSRSNKQGFIRERYPWIEGSNVVLQTATEQLPSAPFDLLPLPLPQVGLFQYKKPTNNGNNILPIQFV